MKKILATMLLTWCGLGLAQTADELLNDGKNTENVTTFGMGYSLQMYSPLMIGPPWAIDLNTFPRDKPARFVDSVTHGKNTMPPWGTC